jgi:GTP-binding protein
MGESEILLHYFFTQTRSKVKIDSHIAAYKKSMFANTNEMPQYFVTLQQNL